MFVKLIGKKRQIHVLQGLSDVGREDKQNRHLTAALGDGRGGGHSLQEDCSSELPDMEAKSRSRAFW